MQYEVRKLDGQPHIMSALCLHFCLLILPKC